MTFPVPETVTERRGERRKNVEQFAFVPPFIPRQVQYQGPLPVTCDGEPDAQRSVVGGAARD
jgi:hypothetical protein